MQWFSGELQLRERGKNGWGPPAVRIACPFSEVSSILADFDPTKWEAMYFPSPMDMGEWEYNISPGSPSRKGDAA